MDERNDVSTGSRVVDELFFTDCEMMSTGGRVVDEIFSTE
jgi:hypothetical protein